MPDKKTRISHQEDFLNNALPLIYKATLECEIIFLKGSFPQHLEQAGVDINKLKTLEETLSALNANITEVTKHLSSIIHHKNDKINTKITLTINGEEKRFLWIGTRSLDETFIQGQFIDIDQSEKDLIKYNNLRKKTYGSLFLGERIAKGQENAKIRDLTVMFVDAVNSTNKIFEMNDEEATSYIEDLSEIITSSTEEHSGYLDKMMGDGAMILWGLRVCSEVDISDHPLLAIHAAKAILAKCDQYNKDKTENNKIQLRIGIDSGDIMCGAFNNPHRMIFTAIGQSVNIAARLESASETGKILISDKHLQRVANMSKEKIEIKKSLNLELKGIPHPILAHQLT